MDVFTAWAVLLLAFIVIVGFISVWRAVVAIKDAMLSGTERAADWFGRRKSGL